MPRLRISLLRPALLAGGRCTSSRGRRKAPPPSDKVGRCPCAPCAPPAARSVGDGCPDSSSSDEERPPVSLSIRAPLLTLCPPHDARHWLMGRASHGSGGELWTLRSRAGGEGERVRRREGFKLPAPRAFSVSLPDSIPPSALSFLVRSGRLILSTPLPTALATSLINALPLTPPRSPNPPRIRPRLLAVCLTRSPSALESSPDPPPPSWQLPPRRIELCSAKVFMISCFFSM